MCNLDDAFATTILTWYDHWPLSEKCNPKCLWCDTSLIFCPFKYKSGCRVRFRLVLIVMLSVFWGLKVTNHWLDHLWILSRSLFNVLLAMTGLSTIMYKVVSSANNLIVDLMSNTISFIYTRNNNGPNIEPWGTPAFTSLMSLLQLFVYDSGDNFRTTDKVYLLSRIVEVYKANPDAKLCRTLCLYHKTRHAPPFPSLRLYLYREICLIIDWLLSHRR